MKKRIFIIAAIVLLLAIGFAAGFVCGQIAEAAYRFRNETGFWMSFPHLVRAIRVGKFDEKVTNQMAIQNLEREKAFLRNPFSIYPHPRQSYEMMPSRLTMIEDSIEELKKPDPESPPGDVLKAAPED